jgi:hypothetical protein
MYIDTNTLPEDFDAADFIKKWQMNKNLFPTITTTSTDWGQITATLGDINITPTGLLEKRMDKLELDNKLLRLKILSMENKFTQEEIANIRKMIMSEDEASRTLADSIIENA